MPISVVVGVHLLQAKGPRPDQKKARPGAGLQSRLKQTAPAQGGKAGNGEPFADEFIRLPKKSRPICRIWQSQSIQTSGFPDRICIACATDRPTRIRHNFPHEPAHLLP
jgi:hypothetical protein